LRDCASPPQVLQRAPREPAQLARYVRARLAAQLYDDSADLPAGTAIAQHLVTARLWLPEQTPWWVKSPRLRPLYRWIRQLYADEGRLPLMVVLAWVEPGRARRAEREQIHECLAKQLPLLNVEGERLDALYPETLPRKRPQSPA
jgi:hypothetical protein